MSDERPEASIEHSLDAAALAALLSQWGALRAGAPDRAALTALERGFESHRAKLFVENATLQADAPDEPAASARIESNQRGIKACTVALGEVREAMAPRAVTP